MSDAKQLFTVNFNCRFCGNEWSDEYEFEMKKTTLNACPLCIATAQKPGTKIRYAAWRRAPNAAVYADKHLKRDEMYTISKIKQWQHGTDYWFEETGNQSFDAMMFTPANFDLTTRRFD